MVTLLFTDIEGGVRLWEADRDAMAAAATRHDRIVREQVEASGGHVFKTVGEAHRAVFADPVAALSAAVAIQRAAGAEPWASEPARQGVHGVAFRCLRGARRRLRRSGGEPGRPVA